MEEVNRVSLKNNKTPLHYKTITWKSYNIVIKQTLSIDEFMNVIHAVFKDCRVSDSDNIVQLELIDFSIKTNIISAYANVELPENLDELYSIVYGTSLYETIYSNVSKIQVQSIIDSVKLCLSGR